MIALRVSCHSLVSPPHKGLNCVLHFCCEYPSFLMLLLYACQVWLPRYFSWWEAWGWLEVIALALGNHIDLPVSSSGLLPRRGFVPLENRKKKGSRLPGKAQKTACCFPFTPGIKNCLFPVKRTLSISSEEAHRANGRKTVRRRWTFSGGKEIRMNKIGPRCSVLGLLGLFQL